MLSIHDDGLQLCDGLTRREWLRIGGLGMGGSGAFGLSLSALLAQRAGAAEGRSVEKPGERRGSARSCILLYQLGGPPQHETWDPKPDAPREIRGHLGCIPSAVPGLHVGELMPRVARLTDRVAVLRAVSTGDNAHSTSGYNMITGVPHSPKGVEGAKPGAPNNWPCVGGIVTDLRRRHPGLVRGVGLPPAITLPEVAANDGGKTWPGQDAGFLGRTADPWLLTCDPSKPDFRVPGTSPTGDLSPLRYQRRERLLSQLDRHLRYHEASGRLERQAHWHQQAFDLLASARAGEAFDLSREPKKVRERYGIDRYSQSVLLARRLVEAGVSLVQVNTVRIPKAPSSGWDTHIKNAENLKFLMPRFDRTFSALIEDLEDRGLLDETLVVWMGEMGRTPKINNKGGRDHWGSVFSIALAGGGVKGGVVHGASDRHGGQPVSGRVGPADITATIFHALGFSPEETFLDPSGRPRAISTGRVIHEIL